MAITIEHIHYDPFPSKGKNSRETNQIISFLDMNIQKFSFQIMLKLSP
jgi:hypothetical protein